MSLINEFNEEKKRGDDTGASRFQILVQMIFDKGVSGVYLGIKYAWNDF